MTIHEYRLMAGNFQAGTIRLYERREGFFESAQFFKTGEERKVIHGASLEAYREKIAIELQEYNHRHKIEWHLISKEEV